MVWGDESVTGVRDIARFCFVLVIFVCLFVCLFALFYVDLG